MDETANHGSRGLLRNNTDRSSPRPVLIHEETTGRILGGFFGVYRELGAGFVEGVYAAALAIELRAHGIDVETEVPVSVYFRGVEVGRFRADMIVQSAVLIELKAAERLATAHEQQVVNYLKATTLAVGLLLNFGPRPSFKRLILTNNNKDARSIRGPFRSVSGFRGLLFGGARGHRRG